MKNAKADLDQVTLGELINECQANGYVYEDAGQGSGFPTNGQFVLGDVRFGEHKDIKMHKLDKPHISADGHKCTYASNWTLTGTGDNPYRFRIFF